MGGTLEGRRVLVVGASAGIGRAAAIRAVQAGADVVLAARRKDLLDEAVEAAGGGTPITVDLCDAGSCRALAEQAVSALGGVDALLFTAGTAPLGPIEGTTPEEWATTLNTNLIGLNTITSTLLPSLSPGAFVAALSSEAVEMPRYWMGVYGASKAALEHLLRTWRLEHPEARFSTITVGATVPTDFGTNFDAEKLTTAINAWATQGLAQMAMMMCDDLADMLVELLGVAMAHPGIGMEHVVLRSPAGITASAEVMLDAAHNPQ